jgi:hypothetical protein
MTDEPTRDEQSDAIVEQLEEAGYLEQYVNATGSLGQSGGVKGSPNTTTLRQERPPGDPPFRAT